LEEESCQPEFLSEGGGRKAFAGGIDSCIVLACPEFGKGLMPYF